MRLLVPTLPLEAFGILSSLLIFAVEKWWYFNKSRLWMLGSLCGMVLVLSSLCGLVLVLMGARLTVWSGAGAQWMLG